MLVLFILDITGNMSEEEEEVNMKQKQKMKGEENEEERRNTEYEENQLHRYVLTTKTLTSLK